MKFLKSRKNSKTIEVSFPVEKMKDLIASHLYATRYVRDEEDILDLELSYSDEQMLNLKIILKVGEK